MNTSSSLQEQRKASEERDRRIDGIKVNVRIEVDDAMGPDDVFAIESHIKAALENIVQNMTPALAEWFDEQFGIDIVDSIVAGKIPTIVVPRDHVQYAQSKVGQLFNIVDETDPAYYVHDGNPRLTTGPPEIVLSRRLLGEVTHQVELGLVHELGHWARDITGRSPRPPREVNRGIQDILRNDVPDADRRHKIIQTHDPLFGGWVETYLYSGEIW